MAAILDPEQQLTFQKPFTKEVVRSLLKITNPPNSPPIIFKIKTTAPKTYCVRPNSGLIMGGEQRVVQVLLQPMETDPDDDFKVKDKFLVMTVAIGEEAAQRISTAPSDSLDIVCCCLQVVKMLKQQWVLVVNCSGE
jgi:hypothetical protein